MRARNLLLILLTGAYLTLWVGGVVSHAFLDSPPPAAAWAAPVFLLLAGLLTLATAGRTEVIILLAAAVVGFAAELIGVRYGLLFGRYVYTETLWPRLFDVPVVMTCAWMVLVAYVRAMLAACGWPGGLRAVAAAAWMTAIDLVIDPLAAGPLAYWRWQDAGPYHGIPTRNFAGWFVVSLCIFGAAEAAYGKGRPNRRARYIGLSIVLFFTLIALANIFSVGLVGAGLVALHVTQRRLSKKNERNDERPSPPAKGES